MPRSPHGTAEIRALFASVDDLHPASGDPLVSADGLDLTDRGSKAQRSYENWRRRKLVPSVLKNSPPGPIDAQYVAHFFRLREAGWLPNSATVLHIFAQGIHCPPEVVQEALTSIVPSFALADEGAEAPQAVQLEDLVDMVLAANKAQGRGNQKNYRETAKGAGSRLLESSFTGGSIVDSVNNDFVPEEAKDRPRTASPEAIAANILAPLISGYLGREIDPSALAKHADPRAEINLKPPLRTLGMNLEDFTPEQLEREKSWNIEWLGNAGRALARLNNDPESISPMIKKVRALFELGRPLVPPNIRPFGIRMDSDEPHDLEILDTLIIYTAAFATEIARRK